MANDNNKKKYIKYEDTTYILQDSRIPDPVAADNDKVLGVVNGVYALKQEQGGGGEGTVKSINNIEPDENGDVALGASDVHALPDSTVIPEAVTEQDVAGWGFTKNTGTYVKPSGGIPASDLAAGVIPDIAETVIGAPGFEEQIAEAVEDYLDESGLVIDATLSQSGSAADAKATGDAIAAVEDQIEAIISGITPIVYETVANSYVRTNTGEINSYNGWSRTDYIPVTAGESINYSNGNATQYCWYYKTDKTPLSQFDLSVTQDGSLTVPQNAAWMIVSDTDSGMASKQFWRSKTEQNYDGMLLTSDIKNAILSLFSYVAYSTPSAQSTYNTLANLFSGGGDSGGGGGDSGGGGSGDGWTSGVAYANVAIVQDEYVKGSGAAAGSIVSYSGWDRTDYLPCAGASTIVVPACPQTYTGGVTTNAFYDSSKAFITTFEISKTQDTTVQVPSNAAYFILSSESAPLATCVGNGITPYS